MAQFLDQLKAAAKASAKPLVERLRSAGGAYDRIGYNLQDGTSFSVPVDSDMGREEIKSMRDEAERIRGTGAVFSGTVRDNARLDLEAAGEVAGQARDAAASAAGTGADIAKAARSVPAVAWLAIGVLALLMFTGRGPWTKG